MQILIVDDSRSTRLVRKRMLAQMGHDDVAEAEDGSGSDGDAVKPITDVTEAKSMLLGLS